ncbi:MAG: thioredoxin [Clostridium sp.]|nr:thioredoxin [Clostridium sp.]MCM1443946.1 thioredoxin [Candidatus Amulumruptor caecigallinarius]
MLANDNNFKELINKDFVLVDFFATWCGPCKMLSPIIDELDNIDVVKVDIDNCENTCKEYGVMSVPTLMIFKKGELVSKKIGYMPKEVIVDWLDENKKL